VSPFGRDVRSSPPLAGAMRAGQRATSLPPLTTGSPLSHRPTLDKAWPRMEVRSLARVRDRSATVVVGMPGSIASRMANSPCHGTSSPHLRTRESVAPAISGCRPAYSSGWRNADGTWFDVVVRHRHVSRRQRGAAMQCRVVLTMPRARRRESPGCSKLPRRLRAGGRLLRNRDRDRSPRVRNHRPSLRGSPLGYRRASTGLYLHAGPSPPDAELHPIALQDESCRASDRTNGAVHACRQTRSPRL
jgi:hypothetical protein